MTAPFTEQMALAILESERSSVRFENFCCELLSAIEERTYVPTSWNYDQGRDGRAMNTGKDDGPSVVCATFRIDILDKAEEDASSLAAKPWKPKVVHFCCTERVTERILDDIKSMFVKHLPGLTALADGGFQLGRYG